MTRRCGGWLRIGMRARTVCLCRACKTRATIGRLVKDLQCPVNILAGPGSLSIAELEKLGVARVSVGSGPMRATLGLVRRMAEELKSCRTYRTLEGAISYADLNRMLE